MSELDNLRPEVADAVSALDETTCMTNPGLKWYATIRTELLRLTGENARLRERVSDTEHFRDVHIRAAGIFRKRAEKAEAELAALRRQIANSEVATIPANFDTTHPDHAGIYVTGGVKSALIGKRVRLLVDEPAPTPEPGSLDELRIERGGDNHG